ncbi:hypothetical protein G6M89_21990 [Natronolimnobius sp. AArcel1]|uniref:hypothetical protein n=1 Tax=Natronolimnobius sp. AArcel1 TaxID=1679093 RepID=UPI0013EBCB00|nr:hypothetical protein [Natronolimnobius sp. AArcel1]NGM71619.1 hypothetical protein [Natronolimnobius sp. AArcel1]
MTENNNNTDDKKEMTGDSEVRKSELSEALGEGFFQKSAESNDEDRPKTIEYDDGYIPARFRSEGRSTGERRARQERNNSDE